MHAHKTLIKYNGFYKTQDCREIVFKLSKGICEGCNSMIKLDKFYHVGHIVPRVDSDLFDKMYPSLDVDNLLNLHALCSTCNLKANRFQTYSVFMLNQMFNENYKKIVQKLDKILQDNGHTQLNIIADFLKANPVIDLFNNNGSILSNKDVLSLIETIKNEREISPILVNKKVKYYQLDYNTLLTPFSICYQNNNDKLIIVDTTISSLNLSRISKIINSKSFIVIKNKGVLLKKMERLILSLGKEITKE
jgi:hypothetical protein